MAHLTVAEARRLAERAMQAIGHTAEEAALIADHLVDCELRGLSYGGLPRALSIAERITKLPRRREPIRVEDKTAVSALVHGGECRHPGKPASAKLRCISHTCASCWSVRRCRT